MDPKLRSIIVDSYNLGSLPEHEQTDLIGKINDLLFQSVVIRAMPLLDKKGLGEMEKMLDADAPTDELFGFLHTNVPTFTDILHQEGESFRNEAFEIMNKIVAGE